MGRVLFVCCHSSCCGAELWSEGVCAVVRIVWRTSSLINAASEGVCNLNDLPTELVALKHLAL